MPRICPMTNVVVVGSGHCGPIPKIEGTLRRATFQLFRGLRKLRIIGSPIEQCLQRFRKLSLPQSDAIVFSAISWTSFRQPPTDKATPGDDDAFVVPAMFLRAQKGSPCRSRCRNSKVEQLSVSLGRVRALTIVVVCRRAASCV